MEGGGKDENEREKTGNSKTCEGKNVINRSELTKKSQENNN